LIYVVFHLGFSLCFEISRVRISSYFHSFVASFVDDCFMHFGIKKILKQIFFRITFEGGFLPHFDLQKPPFGHPFCHSKSAEKRNEKKKSKKLHFG